MSFVSAIAIAIVLLVVSVVLFFMGIVRRSLNTFLLAVLVFLAAAGTGIYGVLVLARKSINHLSVSVDHLSLSRSGMEIYTAVFGRPRGNCTSVTHYTDQVLPRIDCCIWLEFKTCPQELARIAAQGNYTFNRYPASDTLAYETMHAIEPSWWKPAVLGDTVYMLRDQRPEDPNHALFLLFSPDSTHAFYCDFAE